MPPRSSALIRGEFAVRVAGLTELQRALAHAEGDVRKYLRKELRDIANDIRDTARSGVPHKTGRHGGANVPHLAPSIKSRVTATGASVYSDAPHAVVQDIGGRVGHGTILTRANASHYMVEAVNNARPYVAERVQLLLDELATNFDR